MTARGTVLLLGVLLALLGYLWLMETRQVAQPVSATVEEAPLLDGPAAAVARIDLVNPEGRVTAMRRDRAWVDGSGHVWDGTAVADLLETLGTLRPVMEVDPAPEDVDGYGLGSTAQRLHVSGQDGRSMLELEVGERNPAWTGLYVRRVGEQRVVLVGAVLRWELEKLRDAAPPDETSR
jgi:hypothetical protein